MSQRWRFVAFRGHDRAEQLAQMLDDMTPFEADPWICKTSDGLCLTVSMGPSEIGVLYLEGSGGSDDGIPY